MGGGSDKRNSKQKERLRRCSSSSGSDSENQERRSRRHHRKRHKSVHVSRRGDESEESPRKSTKRNKRENKMKEHKRKSRRENKKGDSNIDSHSSSDSERKRQSPENIVRYTLKRFPDVKDDLEQILQMIDQGQAVDTRGISNRSLVKVLKKLFLSLSLTQNDTGVFLLPPKARPTLEIVGSLLCSTQTRCQISHSESPNRVNSFGSDAEDVKNSHKSDAEQLVGPHVKEDTSSLCKKRFIGPEMPSAEVLAAAAKLTEVETELREFELGSESDVLIGPPPPLVVAEAESANDAERFEEVSRIIGVEVDNPYDVLGLNRDKSVGNIKKRYWKLSLLVHPDKCTHPQAHQAFVILNQAFKELQDPEKRKVIDEKIKHKEELEEFKADLQARRETARWRQIQGIALAGDEELLAETKPPPKREEWMTTLPPERKPGVVSMHSTWFSKSEKEGRGDTGIWTDTPLDKAQKARTNYLDTSNRPAALDAGDYDDKMAAVLEKKRASATADLVDAYNQSKRSTSLVHKHREEAATSSRSSKKKNQQRQQEEKEEWSGQHPWKPWDREKDLTAGRQKVNLDSESMAQGLASRFSSGSVQRSFL